MKTEEDEAFDELARKQGSWGGGFKAKRAMAADKLQDGKCKLCIDGCAACDARAQPAQEPERVGLVRIAEKLRSAGASLPAPELTGTIEGSFVSGLCVALAIVEREIEALAQPAQEPSACCHACFKASGVMVMTRMILCPSCGNKRCPKASNHRLECTDSNESGQAGSVYTAAQPAQETDILTIAYQSGYHDGKQAALAGREPVACEQCKKLEEQVYDLLGQLKAANLKWSVAHPWVGLTDEEREGVAQDYSLTGLGYQSPFKAIEAMLKEKNK